MQNNKQLILLILLPALLIVSCNRVAPGGFWTGYQTNFLVQNISGQGTRGGTRTMHWKTTLPNTFTPQAVIAFATQNGWKLVGSIDSLPDQHGKGEYATMPQCIGPPSRTYIFKTGWMLFEPGTDNSTEENGFVSINSSGTEMSVHHSWGE